MHLAHTSGQVLLMAGLYNGSFLRSLPRRCLLSSLTPLPSTPFRLLQSSALCHLPSSSPIPSPPHRLGLPHRLVRSLLSTRTSRRLPTPPGRLPRDVLPLLPLRPSTFLSQTLSARERAQGRVRRVRRGREGRARLVDSRRGRFYREGVGAGRKNDG